MSTAAEDIGFAPLITGAAPVMWRSDCRAPRCWRRPTAFVLGASVALLTALMRLAAGSLPIARNFAPFDPWWKRRTARAAILARARKWRLAAPEFRALGKTLGDMADSIARTQASLGSSERQLRLLAENSTDMILLVQPGGRRVYASPAAANYGLRPEEMLGVTTLDAIIRGSRHSGGTEILSRHRGDDLHLSHAPQGRSYVWVESVSR